jgi:hypothetical protein
MMIAAARAIVARDALLASGGSFAVAPHPVEKLEENRAWDTNAGGAANPGSKGAAASKIGHPLTSPPTER